MVEEDEPAPPILIGEEGPAAVVVLLEGAVVVVLATAPLTQASRKSAGLENCCMGCVCADECVWMYIWA